MVTHQMESSGGRYECTEDGCGFDTLNVWTAEHHFAENNPGADMSAADCPDWLLP